MAFRLRIESLENRETPSGSGPDLQDPNAPPPSTPPAQSQPTVPEGFYYDSKTDTVRLLGH